jgi:hypothetical protein
MRTILPGRVRAADPAPAGGDRDGGVGRVDGREKPQSENERLETGKERQGSRRDASRGRLSKLVTGVAATY